MKNKTKAKVIDRANKLIKWLYNYNLHVSDKDLLSSEDKFILLNYDFEIRKITQELINKWENSKPIPPVTRTIKN